MTRGAAPRQQTRRAEREFVVSSQRERLIDAMAEACAEKGYRATSVADVVAGARVSRATFYELFHDKEDCFLAAYDTILAQFLGKVIGAYQQDATWAQRIRFGLETILRFGASEPAFARMCLIEVLAAGPAAVERYQGGVRVVAALVDEGQDFAEAGRRLPPRVGRAVVGGGVALVRDELIAGRAERLPELLPDLLYTTLVPYLGHEGALLEMRAARDDLAP
ncbi:MAG: TetR/AcrR family transcriptional regulator [Thermoleophilaceae bacterium]